MAISQVRININGAWTTLTYNSGTGKWTGTVTAPTTTSYNQSNGYYAAIVEATTTAGTKTTATVDDATVGNALKLQVKEQVKPTISITSPGSGAFVTNSQQPIVFSLRDEAGGSGIKLSSLALKIDGGTAVGSAGITCTAVTNGYDCVYTPPVLADGSHSVTINVTDNDGNAATQASRSYTIDTQPPVLNVTNPANGFLTNTAALVVQGTTNDAISSPVTVTVKLSSGTANATTVDGSGNFAAAITLAEGANTIVVTATDAAGKQSVVTLTGTLDTTVPIISSVSITPNPANAGATLTISVVIA